MKHRYAPLAAGALIVVSLAAVHVPLAAPVYLYTGAFVVASSIYLLLARLLLRNEVNHAVLSACIALAVLVRLSFLLTPPIGSDDVWRYLWDGRVQAGGISPYRFPPDAGELVGFHTPLLPTRVNHPEMKSAYFPLDEWAFAAGYRLSGESIWGWKLILLLSEALTFAGLRLLLRQAGRPAGLILLYALCPLPVMSFALDGHVDALGLPFMVFALLHLLRGRKTLALILIGLSIAVKPVAVVMVPLLFFGERTLMARARVLLIPAATLAATFLPYLGGPGPWEPLLAFTQHWAFNGSVFSLLYGILDDNQVARGICGIAFALALLFVARGSRDIPSKVYSSVLLLLLLSPVVHPWYVVWLTVLLPVVPAWSGVTFSATVSLTALTVLAFVTGGTWTQSPAILLLEYLPVGACAFLELRARWPSRVHSL